MKLLFPILILIIIAQTPAANATDTADYVYTNAKVYTVDETQPWAEAVTVQGNKIVYVGDTAGAEALISSDTEVIDATR